MSKLFRVLDHDTYSSHGPIGKIYVDITPLVNGSCPEINGWLPIFDTIHGKCCYWTNYSFVASNLKFLGIRGELWITMSIRFHNIKLVPNAFGVHHFCCKSHRQKPNTLRGFVRNPTMFYSGGNSGWLPGCRSDGVREGASFGARSRTSVDREASIDASFEWSQTTHLRKNHMYAAKQ